MDIFYQIGKNAVENTELILRSSEMDIWFHISGLPSAHLVYYNPDNHDINYLQKKGIIRQMATILKMRSKYKKYNHIDVIYDYIKNIKPLTIPGKVLCTTKNSIRV